MGKRGINVPEDLSCVGQYYHDSTVEEYYASAADRDARVSQLQSLGRFPVRYFTSSNVRLGLTSVWGLRWTEPRGEDLDAIRAGS